MHAEVKVVKEVEEVFVARKSPHVARALSRASHVGQRTFDPRGVARRSRHKRYSALRQHAPGERARHQRGRCRAPARSRVAPWPGESCGKRLPAAGGLRLCGQRHRRHRRPQRWVTGAMWRSAVCRIASGVREAILAPEAAAQACGGDKEGVVDA